MTSICEQIMAVLDGRIAALAAARNGEYERDPSGDPSAFPAYSLTQGTETPLGDSETGITRYALDVEIEVYAEGLGGSPVAALLNEIHAEVVAAVMQEPPLGGLAESFKEGQRTPATAMLADHARKGFRKPFTLTFTTRRGNPAIQ